MQGLKQADAKPLHSREVMRFSALSHGAFWRLLHLHQYSGHLHGLVQRAEDNDTRRFFAVAAMDAFTVRQSATRSS